MKRVTNLLTRKSSKDFEKKVENALPEGVKYLVLWEFTLKLASSFEGYVYELVFEVNGFKDVYREHTRDKTEFDLYRGAKCLAKWAKRNALRMIESDDFQDLISHYCQEEGK